MNCKIVKSVQELKLTNSYRKSGWNYVVSQLQRWERDFGLGESCPFDQSIRFTDPVVMKQFFVIIDRLQAQGYVEIDRTYAHIRLDNMRDEQEWLAVDKRVQRWVKQGKLVLVPYVGYPYTLYSTKEESHGY